MNRLFSQWLWGPLSRLGLCVAAITFVLDQGHKWWMIAHVGMVEGQTIPVAGFFDWKYLLNKGVSYSFLTGSSQRWQYILATFAVIAAVALVVWLARGVTDRLSAVSVGLIIGGALGNGLDRVTLGGVADFFSLHAFGFYWYVFNIADVAIVAGVVGLLYESLIPSVKSESGSSAATKPTQIGH